MSQRIDKFLKITKALKHLQRGDAGPRAIAALIFSVIVCFVINFGGLIFFEVFAERTDKIIFGLLTASLISCALTYVFILEFNSSPKTWIDAIDSHLSDYDPINKSLFLQLQKSIKSDGWNYSVIKDWADMELEEIARDSTRVNNPGHSRFLERDL